MLNNSIFLSFLHSLAHQPVPESLEHWERWPPRWRGRRPCLGLQPLPFLSGEVHAVISFSISAITCAYSWKSDGGLVNNLSQILKYKRTSFNPINVIHVLWLINATANGAEGPCAERKFVILPRISTISLGRRTSIFSRAFDILVSGNKAPISIIA